MGNICPCFGSRKDESNGEEQDRLLNDPTEVPADRTSLLGDDPAVLQRDSRDYGTMNGSSSNHKPEVSAWNRVLEKMASDVIDVSTIEAQNNPIEQSEWMERSRMYANKVANSRVGSILKSACRPKPAPKVDLSSAIDQAFEPISESDLAMINEFSEAAVNAVKSGFVVNIDEDLIVQFDPSNSH